MAKDFKKKDPLKSLMGESKTIEDAFVYLDEINNISVTKPIQPKIEIQEEKLKVGRPRKTDIVRDSSAQRGLPKEYTRQTFIVRTDLNEKLKDLAYTDRVTVKELMEDMLENYLKDKKIKKRKK